MKKAASPRGCRFLLSTARYAAGRSGSGRYGRRRVRIGRERLQIPRARVQAADVGVARRQRIAEGIRRAHRLNVLRRPYRLVVRTRSQGLVLILSGVRRRAGLVDVNADRIRRRLGLDRTLADAAGRTEDARAHGRAEHALVRLRRVRRRHARIHHDALRRSNGRIHGCARRRRDGLGRGRRAYEKKT